MPKLFSPNDAGSEFGELRSLTSTAVRCCVVSRWRGLVTGNKQTADGTVLFGCLLEVLIFGHGVKSTFGNRGKSFITSSK